MSLLICPYCSAQFSLEVCKIVSRDGAVLHEAQFGPLAHQIRAQFLTELLRLSRQPFSYVCPNCDRELPPHFEQAENIIIAIIGDGACSGVSTYTAALLHELQEGTLQRMYHNVLVSAFSPTTWYTHHNKYLAPLFLNNCQLPASQPINSVYPQLHTEPLLYEFIIQSTSDQRLRRINLIFYDTPGENIINRKFAHYAQYIFHASAIIFLVDPLNMPDILKHLPEQLKRFPPNTIRSSENLSGVLLELHQNLEQKLPLPLAITISKADLLQYLKEPEENPYTFLSESERNSPIDPNEFHFIDTEVRSVIEQFGDQALLRSANLCQDSAFFAAAPTGCSVDENGRYPFVKPLRCLDPLIWILWKLGVLEAH